MRLHRLKIWPEFFEAINSGRKNFELRKNDRVFQEGDEVILAEWLPYNGLYTGRELHMKVTYVLFGMPGLEIGFCIMALERIE